MTRYRPSDLVDFAAALFHAAGMAADKARTVGEILVEADLMGHTTHGLQLAPAYLDDLASGGMTAAGHPITMSDHKAAVVWNGRRLSGIALTVAALDLASERAREYGTATVAVREAHHTACLAAYLTRITGRGQMVMIVCSDPAVATVAPFGGLDPVFTPDPMAFGIPTEGDPILIDMSASITTNGMAARLRGAGGRFPGQWAQDADGALTDDPHAIVGERTGTLLPTGGHDHGHKGYGLALLVEALSQGLSGEGRSTKPTHWGASIFVQVFEPEAFSGLAAFTRETSTLAALCHASRPAPGVAAVRLPGERALANRRAALRDGLQLYPGILDRLAPWAEKLQATLPSPSTA
jgi:LDH2 family malate/lactate/ureidoglycolate dehydrogenase